MNIQNSRFITYPDILDKQQNDVILLVDSDIVDIENAGLFCKTSIGDYDIYLYRHDMNESEWLTSIANLADIVLINQISEINLSGTNVKRYGDKQELKSPLQYLREIDARR